MLIFSSQVKQVYLRAFLLSHFLLLSCFLFSGFGHVLLPLVVGLILHQFMSVTKPVV